MSELEIKYIPISDIYSDDNFNCRGVIATIDVSELARDIRKHGLQMPITVQPGADVDGGLPDGKTHRIVAGHRRFKANSVLEAGWEKGDPNPNGIPVSENPYSTITCIVKTGLDEIRARVLNLGENLQREDLNIMQEAKAISHLHELGLPRDHVAEELGKSSGWVQTRYYALEMPEDIQQEIAAGTINQLQIKKLYSLRANVDDQYEAVRLIKQAKAKGQKPPHIGKSKPKPTDVKRERKRPEITKMITFVGKHCKYGITTRALAWAAGEISTDEFFVDLAEAIEAEGKRVPFFPKEF